jgi:tellurite resistance protein TerC
LADNGDPAEPAAQQRHAFLRLGRRIGIAIAGSAVLLVGIIMIVTPGPAFVVIPMGLGILSLEFERPRRWLAHLKERAAKVSAAILHRQR